MTFFRKVTYLVKIHIFH